MLGSEIKSIREGGASINEAFCVFQKKELFIRNMNVDPYENEGHFGHEPRRDRKLLLHRQELEKLQKKLKDQGMTIVPTRLFIGKSGYAKMEIALAKGKKTHDRTHCLGSPALDYTKCHNSRK